MSYYIFFFSCRRRHTRLTCDWSSDVCSSDLDVCVHGVLMKARPILMHARSIENLLAGRKTQTRRIIKPQPDGQMFPRDGKSFWMPGAFSSQREPVACPYGGPGDLLWVRERHSFNEPMKSSAGGD